MKSFTLKIAGVIVAVVLVASGATAVYLKPSDPASAGNNATPGSLLVSDLIADDTPITTVGTLKGSEQVDVRPQMQGPVTSIPVKVGQTVYAGQILAELAHRDLDASLAQASASVQSAKAQLEKAKNGARPEDLVSVEQNLVAAQQTLADMKRGGRPEEVAQAKNNVSAAESALNDANTNYVRTEEQNTLSQKQALENSVLAISSAQIALDKMLHQDLTILFNQNNGDNMIPASEDAGLVTQADEARDDMGSRLQRWETRFTAVNKTDLAAVRAAVQDAQTELQYQLSFLDVTNAAMQVAVAIPSFDEVTLSKAKDTVNSSRAMVKNQINIMVSSQQAIDNVEINNRRNLETAKTKITVAATQLKNSQEALEIVTRGPTSEMLAVQEARVKQAEQAVASAKNGRPEDIHIQQAFVAQAQANWSFAAAQRDKAILRAPIAGTITALPIHLGDQVTTSTLAASLSNASVVQVDVYVTETERGFLNVGNAATIEDSIPATITEIDPALDKATNKIRVVVTLSKAAPTLTLGKTVRVDLSKVAAEQSIVHLPLTALKFTDSGAQVFRLNADNSVEAVPVEFGQVAGNSIEIKTLLQPDWHILTQAKR